MSAHWKKLVYLQTQCGQKAYSIETSGRVAIALNLHSGIHSIGDIGAENGFVEQHVWETEGSQSLNLKGLMQGDVVVGTRIGSQRQENLHGGLRVTHG